MIRSPKTWLAVLLLAALVVRWWGIFSADIGTDEPTYTLNGDEYVKALVHWDWEFASGLKIEHPPVSTWLYGLAFQTQHLPWSGFSYYRSPKRLAGLMVVASCLILFLIGARLYGPWTGLWAAALLAFMPHAVAHSRIAGLAAPSLLFWLLSFYFLLRGLEPGAGRKWFLWLGAAFGLATGTRISNGLILPAVATSLLLVRLYPGERLRWPGWSWQLVVWPVLGGVVFVGLWPWLWSRPVEHLLHTLAHWDLFISSGFHGWAHNYEYFLGRSVLPPWYYYFFYLGLTTPLLVLVGALVWLGRLVRRAGNHNLLLLIWLAAPLGVSFLTMKGDGIRYVFACLGFLALASARGLETAADRLAGLFRKPESPFRIGLAAVSVGSCLWAVFSYWPYHLDYYNLLAGDPVTIQKERTLRFGWWGEGVQACVEYIQDNLAPGTRIGFYPVLSGKFSMLHPDYPLVPLDQAEYAVTHIDFDKPEKWAGWEPVFEERLKGAPLARVYKRLPAP